MWLLFIVVVVSGTACRLAKRWIKCQLFGGYINDETVELLMAYVYIHPAPSLAVPVAPERGFIRFLRLLATFDWLKYPLPINFNQEMSASEVESMERDFTADRQNNLGPESMPPMSLVIPFERTSVWTRKNPPALIVKRLRLVAKASLDEVQAGLLTGHTWDPKVRPCVIVVGTASGYCSLTSEGWKPFPNTQLRFLSICNCCLV